MFQCNGRKNLGGTRFQNEEEVVNAVTEYFDGKRAFSSYCVVGKNAQIQLCGEIEKYI